MNDTTSQEPKPIIDTFSVDNAFQEHCVILAPMLGGTPITEILGFQSRHDEKGGKVFEAMLAIHERGSEITRESVLRELFVRGTLRSVGGADYLDGIARDCIRGGDGKLKVLGESRKSKDPNRIACGACDADAYALDMEGNPEDGHLWRFLCEACCQAEGARYYCIELDRIETVDQALDWTLHMMGKYDEWFGPSWLSWEDAMKRLFPHVRGLMLSSGRG